MKKLAAILIISLASLSTINARNVANNDRGGYRDCFHRRFHDNYHRGFREGFYANIGYRAGFYRPRVCAPVWVPGYWIYDNYGNAIQWVNGYYR